MHVDQLRKRREKFALLDEQRENVKSEKRKLKFCEGVLENSAIISVIHVILILVRIIIIIVGVGWDGVEWKCRVEWTRVK